MPEQHPGEHPGHLDIDAVSAYVDRDLEAAELTTIAMHLGQCPACEREVLEIRTTVLLLSRLPAYEPRRSFLLGQEHARASRRDRPRPAMPALSPPLPASQLPGGGTPGPIAGPPVSGWMPALQVAALVTGVLLLLITVGDLSGFVGQEPAAVQLAAPTALAEAPPLEALPADSGDSSAPMAAIAPDSDAVQAPAPAPEAAFQQAADEAGGTFGASSASDEVSEREELARSVPRLAATSVAAASVTQAIPTPGAATTAVDSAAPEGAATAADDGSPSRLRIVQLALALILAWLVVSMAGARWIRRLR